MTRFRRRLFIVLGLVSTGLGIIGIVLPVLPTTPFLLLAGLLLADASPKLHSWLRRNRVTGPFLAAYTDGTGMSRRRKAWTIALLWTALAVSAYFTRHLRWMFLVLGAVGIGVTVHIATIRPKNRRRHGVEEQDGSADPPGM